MISQTLMNHSFPDIVTLHTVGFNSGREVPVWVSPCETLGKAIVRRGLATKDVTRIVVSPFCFSGPLHYEPDLTVASR